MTKYFKQRLMPVNSNEWGQIMRGTEDASSKYYLRNSANEVAELPHWLWVMVEGGYGPTLRWGPYLFYCTFEDTTEAKYLMEMFKHRVLTPVAETKVRNILDKYKPLIHINESFVQALIEREGCPDYWSREPEVMSNENYNRIQEVFNGNKN